MPAPRHPQPRTSFWDGDGRPGMTFDAAARVTVILGRSWSPGTDVHLGATGADERPGRVKIRRRGPTTPSVKERFHFGLERVRQVRVHDEDRAKEALAASVARRALGEANLRSAAERIADARAGGSAAGTTLDAATLIRRQAFLERLERSRIAAELDLHRATEEVDSHRRVLAGKSRDRQVLDRLHDRQAGAHAVALARHQATVLDEIALQGHVRRSAA